MTKLCDKDGVRKSCVCRSAISATRATRNEGRCHQAPCPPRKVQVDVTKCHACHAKVPRRHAQPRGPKRHACHAKCKWTSPSAAPATQKCRGVTRAPSAPPDACHAKRRWMSPRLPRKVQVDVTKCRAFTQKCCGVTPDQGAPSVSPDPAQSYKGHSCHAKRRWMSPRLPRKVQVDVTKCRACHAKVLRRHA